MLVVGLCCLMLLEIACCHFWNRTFSIFELCRCILLQVLLRLLLGLCCLLWLDIACCHLWNRALSIIESCCRILLQALVVPQDGVVKMLLGLEFLKVPVKGLFSV